MPAAALRPLLLSIVILLFAVVLALSSTGMGEVVMVIALIGLLVGLYGAFRR